MSRYASWFRGFLGRLLPRSSRQGIRGNGWRYVGRRGGAGSRRSWAPWRWLLTAGAILLLAAMLLHVLAGRSASEVLMAWTFTAARGSAGDRTADTTISMNPSANLVVGAIVVVTCASDNNGTTDSETSEHTLADSQSNRWHKVREQCSSSGAANDGVTGSAWLCKVTTQIGTGDTITLTTSASKTAKCLCAIEVSSTAGAWDLIDVQVDSGTDNSPTAASLTIKSAAVLALGIVFIESSDTALSAEDADYTNRTTVRSGSAGGSAANVAIFVATRIATLTSDTYAPTTSSSSDHTGMIVLLREAATKTRTRMVKSSGGHHTSLSSWESGQQADLTTEQEIRQAECWDFSDTTSVTIDGWTTSSTYYIRIYTPSDERHDGTTGTGYRLNAAANPTLMIREDWTRIEGIEVISSVGGSNTCIMVETSGSSVEVLISHCLVRSAVFGIMSSFFLSGSCTIKCRNTIVYNCSSVGAWGNASAVTHYWHNVTVCDCGTGGSPSGAFVRSSGTYVAQNCVAQNPNDALGGGSSHFSGTMTQSYNVSGDATASGTGSRTNKTVTFAAAGTDDFRLSASDAEAKDLGTDLSGDANLPVTDDIVGTSRPQGSAFDMGASEVVVTPKSLVYGRRPVYVLDA